MGSLVHAFAEQVKDRGQQIALVSDGRALTYAALNGAANQFARVLISHGVKRGDLVAVSVDRSCDTFVVLLGILKAGCAYVPLDAALPAARRLAIVTTSRARLFVAAHQDFLLPGFDGRVILYPAIESERAAAGADDLPCPPHDSDVCCVLHTSGTTGTPKGVVVPGTAILNHAAWMWRAYPFRDGDLALVHRPCVYMAATWDYFGPLLGGAPLLILQGHHTSDLAPLVRSCIERGVSHVSGSPGFWRTVLDRPSAELAAWRTLRLGSSSGEALPVSIVRDWRRAFPHATLLNVYGITEAVRPAVYDTRGVAEDDTRVPIGTPLPHVDMSILDERGAPVESGAVGEICVAGPCVTRGYLDPEALGSHRFAADPIAGGRMMFRTGDLARQRADGAIELVARTDHQVKVRGFRVELEEVEEALHACPGVRRAVVVVHRDAIGETSLIAYVVASDGAYPTWREFRAFLEERLPDYMIPASFVLVDAIPLTPSGKVDRQALRALGSPAPRRAPAPDLIPTATEAALTRIWSAVIGVPDLEPVDSFLDLGGHSLMAMNIATRVQLAFGVELPLESFFSNPTLRVMAAAIDSLRNPQGDVQPLVQ